MRKLIVLSIGFVLIVPLLKYGTINPCGMLKAELSGYLWNQYGQQTNVNSNWERVGKAISIGLGGVIGDPYINALSPLECLQLVARIQIEQTFSQASQQSEIDLTAKVDLKSAATWNKAYYKEYNRYASNMSDLYDFGFKPQPQVRMLVLPAEEGLGSGFRIAAWHTESQKGFLYSSAVGPFRPLREVPVTEIQ